MAKVENDEQMAMEDEVLTGRKIEDAAKAWSNAQTAVEEAAAGPLVAERNRAKDALVELLPPDDDRAHTYRVGATVITVEPPGEEPTRRPWTPKRKVRVKRAAD